MRKHLLQFRVHKGAVRDIEKKFFLPFDTIEIMTGVRDVKKDRWVGKHQYQTVRIL